MQRKKINILLVLAVLMVIGGTPSCKKVDDFGVTNQDPGSTPVPVTGALFTTVLSNMAALTWDAGGATSTTIAGLYAQYYSETQYTDVSIFQKQNRNWDDYFAPAIFAAPNTNQYTQTGFLYDLQTIIKFNTDADKKIKAAASGSNSDQIAIARILKA